MDDRNRYTWRGTSGDCRSERGKWGHDYWGHRKCHAFRQRVAAARTSHPPGSESHTPTHLPRRAVLPTPRMHVLTIITCSTLYYTILYYTILYYTILYYTILYYTILYYTILYYTILYYNIIQHIYIYIAFTICMYIYIYIYIHICICVYIYIHIYICILYIYIYIHMYTHIHVPLSLRRPRLTSRLPKRGKNATARQHRIRGFYAQSPY